MAHPPPSLSISDNLIAVFLSARLNIVFNLSIFPQIIIKVDTENGNKRFLIPSLLKREQKDCKWMHFDGKHCPFLFMMGRVCKSNITLNPCTVSVVQHILGKDSENLNAFIEFFQGGVIMLYDEIVIIMHEILLHQGVCVKIGIRKDKCSPARDSLKKLIKKSGELLDDIFTGKCCRTIEERNASELERKVLSLEGMMKGDDTIHYKLSDVEQTFKKRTRFIYSSVNARGDRTSLLLTESEKRNLYEEVST